MTVLVIGGTGFIGSRIVRRLVQAGQEPVCFDSSPNTFRLDDLAGRYRFVQGDITHVDDIIAAITENGVDQVINMAYVLRTDAPPQEAVRIDVMGMNNAFEAARLTGVRRVLYASSIARHGPQRAYGDQTVVSEDDPGYPNSLYGWAKQFNEVVAGQYAERYGMSMAAVRPAYVWGAAPRRFGPVGASHMVADAALGKPVTVRSDPNVPFLLVHVEDVAEIFFRLSQAPSIRYPAYLSGGQVATFQEIADITREFIPDADIGFDPEDGRVYDLIRLVDPERVKTELGFEHPPLAQRVLDTITFERRLAGGQA